ncbi:ArsB/NhaD family transporter, partial [Dermatophilus congolensis]
WVEGVGGLGWLGGVLGSAEGVGGLLRVAGVTALLANVVNNLPAYLAVEGVVPGDAVGLMAVLVGANVGPLVTPWGSLATLLWLQRCSAAGVKWNVWRLGGAGVVCAGCAVVAATVVLGVVG